LSSPLAKVVGIMTMRRVTMISMNDLVKFLNGELKRRSWSQRELARRADLSHSLISQVLSEQVRATPEFCIAVADALGEAREDVLRMAGVLPPLPQIDGDASMAKTLEVMKRLTPEEREEVLAYVLWRYEQQRGR